MISIKFNAADHSYWVGEERIPSVTQILLGSGVVDYPEGAGQKRYLGTLAHQATAENDEGELADETVPTEILGYLHAWRGFRMATGFKPEIVERVVWSPTHRYAGTVDRVGQVFGCRAVVDIKTGLTPTWAGLQLAAYQEALRESGIETTMRLVVEVAKTGRFRVREQTDLNDLPQFLEYRRKHVQEGY